jgi:hypothetical protein
MDSQATYQSSYTMEALSLYPLCQWMLATTFTDLSGNRERNK